VSSVHAHWPEEDHTDLVGEFSNPESPILLADIDRVLEMSARIEHAYATAPIRVWRDDLRIALESLDYARAVLAADVGILRHCLAGADQQAVVDDLPAVMSARSWGDGWSEPAEVEDDDTMDWSVFARSDQLMSTHQEMAAADLSSRDDVARVLADLEAQLTDLGQRQEAVENRLQQIRAAIVRQYEDGEVPARDWLG
jgi:hypothetical protein